MSPISQSNNHHLKRLYHAIPSKIAPSPSQHGRPPLHHSPKSNSQEHQRSHSQLACKIETTRRVILTFSDW